MTPQKYPQNLHTPKNIHFSDSPKNIEIQNFEPQKNDPSLCLYEIIRVPPPPPLGSWRYVHDDVMSLLHVSTNAKCWNSDQVHY